MKHIRNAFCFFTVLFISLAGDALGENCGTINYTTGDGYIDASFTYNESYLDLEEIVFIWTDPDGITTEYDIAYDDPGWPSSDGESISDRLTTSKSGTFTLKIHCNDRPNHPICVSDIVSIVVSPPIPLNTPSLEYAISCRDNTWTSPNDPYDHFYIKLTNKRLSGDLYVVYAGGIELDRNSSGIFEFNDYDEDLDLLTSLSAKTYRSGKGYSSAINFTFADGFFSVPVVTGNSNLCDGSISLNASPVSGDANATIVEWKYPDGSINTGSAMNEQAAGTYYVRVKDNHGVCKSNASTVTVSQSAGSPPSVGDEAICGSETDGVGTVQFTATAGFSSYEWDVSGGMSSIVGPQDTHELTVKAYDDVLVRVRGTTTGGCVSGWSAQATGSYSGIISVEAVANALRATYKTRYSQIDNNLEEVIFIWYDKDHNEIERRSYSDSDWDGQQSRTITDELSMAGRAPDTYRVRVESYDEPNPVVGLVCSTDTRAVTMPEELLPPGASPSLEYALSCEENYWPGEGSSDGFVHYYIKISGTLSANDAFELYDDGVLLGSNTTGVFEFNDQVNNPSDFDNLTAKICRSGIGCGPSLSFSVSSGSFSAPLITGNTNLCDGTVELTASPVTGEGASVVEWKYPDGSIVQGAGMNQQVTGNYLVRVKESNGICKSPVRTVSITQTTATPTVNDEMICGSEPGGLGTVTFTATSGFSSYQWFLQDHNSIVGQTANTITVKSYSDMTVEVEGTSVGGCVSSRSQTAKGLYEGIIAVGTEPGKLKATFQTGYDNLGDNLEEVEFIWYDPSDGELVRHDYSSGTWDYQARTITDELSTTGLIPGTYKVRAVSYDRPGSVQCTSGTKEVTITAEQLPPTSSPSLQYAISCRDNTWTSPNDPYEHYYFKVTGPLSGNDQFELYGNGNLLGSDTTGIFEFNNYANDSSDFDNLTARICRSGIGCGPEISIVLSDGNFTTPLLSGNSEICNDPVNLGVNSQPGASVVEWKLPDNQVITSLNFTDEVAGQYAVRVTDEHGVCKSIALSFEITQTLPPDPVIDAAQTFCNWQSIPIEPENLPAGGAFRLYDSEGALIEEEFGTIVLDPVKMPQTLELEIESVNHNERCVSANRTPVTITIKDDCDEDMNWVEATTYDHLGNYVSREKNYFDLMGRPSQSQSVTFNAHPVTGQDVVFATHTLTDALDREVMVTLPAPLVYFDRETSGDGFGEIDFRYDRYFIADETDKIYDYTNFDPDNLRYAPEPVGRWEEGSLGWYYSENNTLEPYTPETDFPFTINEYYDDGTGEPKRIAGPGDFHFLGSGKETLAGTFGVTAELSEYADLHKTVFSRQEAIGLTGETVLSISIDANGQSVISVMDKGEKVLMTAEGIDPGDATADSQDFTCTGSTSVAAGKTVLYFYLLQDQAVAWSGTGTYTLTDILNDEPVAPVPANLPKGFYKVSLTGDQDVSVTYTNRFTSISYNFYDEAGRLVSSVSPNGVLAWRNDEVSYEAIDKTTYEYNHLGRLISMTEPDAGTTRYLYRKDGSVRFSQNAMQALGKIFSYTHYDKSGRPVESGAYAGSTLKFDTDTPNGNDGLKDQLEYTYNESYRNDPLWTRDEELKDWVFTGYDLPDTEALWNTIGLEEATATDEEKKDFTQTFLMGAVSYTENTNMKTWYSYDYRGRVTWMLQAPKEVAGSEILRVFKIGYTYDFLGNVTDVVFEAFDPQDGEMTAIEEFRHHYEYDANQRLSEVRAGANTENPLPVQARYEYYLHGPLKRVELGGNKQGIDYVYTTQGWLKSINHPDGNKDPGQDGKPGAHSGFEEDLFAMTLEYFNGDYTLGGIGSVDAGQEYFNGNIRNVTWRTGSEKYGASPVMYQYTYDDKYQLKGAEFGIPDYIYRSMASQGDRYRVGNLSYDANGNILGLRRYKGLETGGTVDVLHDFYNPHPDTAGYSYEANTNKLTSVTGYAGYAYNAIGQLEKETALLDGRENRNMYYDVTGKMTAVKDDAGNEKVSFAYDDRGFRLMKKKHAERPEDPDVETWYIRDASGNVLSTYEKTGSAAPALKETMVYGSGRLGMYRHDFIKADPDVDYITGAEVRNAYEEKDYQLLPGGSLRLTGGFTFEASGSETLRVSTIDGDEVMGASQYELTDHLGNVRIGVVDESSAITFDASMEPEKAAEEEQYFMNMGSRYMDPLYNHTATGTYSSKLNPVDPAHAYTIGPAINLGVSPGDTVRMEVFAKYLQSITDINDVVTGIGAAIAASFGNTSPLGEGASLVGAFGEALAGGAAIPNTDRQGAPKAYIQYIVFNKNMTMAQHGHIMVTDEAMANWQKLELEVPIEENGYIYVYVANESNEGVNVYFDDLEVQLIDAPVTSASDYYPFGLAMAGRSYSSEKYRFGYQGQFAEMDEETGWNSFELRMYEPVIGRWLTTDPARQYFSPYLSMNNSPITNVDPDGAYSKFGAWWRNGFSMDGVKVDSDGEYGFFRGTGDDMVYMVGNHGTFTRDMQSSFYDESTSVGRLFHQRLNSDPLFRADMGIGDGIEFDPVTQLTLGFVAVGAVSSVGRLVSTFESGLATSTVAEGSAPLSNTITLYSRGSVLRAPKGGIRVGGKFYKGGQYYPGPRLYFQKGVTNYQSALWVNSRSPWATRLMPGPAWLRYSVGAGGAGLLIYKGYKDLTK
ncbi:MAG: hypothetical protein MI975_21630 [Cytophagales bacterium]|nr:hypothetical protein [Cytophagales bacterium]